MFTHSHTRYPRHATHRPSLGTSCRPIGAPYNPARSHNRHIRRRLAPSSAPTAAGFKLDARTQLCFLFQSKFTSLWACAIYCMPHASCDVLYLVPVLCPACGLLIGARTPMLCPIHVAWLGLDFMSSGLNTNVKTLRAVGLKPFAVGLAGATCVGGTAFTCVSVLGAAGLM